MSIKSLGILGAGQMGAGIAQSAAQNGFHVLLADVTLDRSTAGRAKIEKDLNKLVEKGKIAAAQVTETMGRIKAVGDIESLRESDFIIEAATENVNLKYEIFKKFDAVAKPGVILASNTSSISITAIGGQTKRPELVVGMHFMNPVPVMKLVEGIKGLRTSDATFATMKNVAEQMQKTVITALDYPGFAVNRILCPMLNEAIYALYEGLASVEDIDTAMKLGTNQPMGPLTLADFVGLDTLLAIMNVLQEGLGDAKYRPCPLLKQYVAAGLLGRKSGIGFYDYRSGTPVPTKFGA